MNNFALDGNTVLKQSNAAHAAALFQAIDDNREHLGKYLPWISNMKNTNTVKQYLEHCKLLCEKEAEVSFEIFNNNQIVGRISLHHIDKYNNNAAIGYWLVKEAEGKGIITRSCKEILHYAFMQIKLHRIEIMFTPENIKSRAIPEKLGFIQEGILRQTERINNKYQDVVVYSLLRSEWLRKL